MVLANALGEKFSVLADLEDVVGTPTLALLFVTQATPEEWVSILTNSDMRKTHCLSSISMAIRMKPLGVVP